MYAFDENEFISGTKKSKQRWEQCMLKLFATYGPALQALYAVRYFDNKVHEAAKNFTKEAVKDVIAELKNRDIHDDAIEELVEKLESIHYNIGYTDKVLNLQKIEEFYKDLKLIGDEEIVETFLKIENYDRKISNDPESNWKRKLKSKTSEVEIKYFTDDNILCKFK